jgi:hypothetical protein
VEVAIGGGLVHHRLMHNEGPVIFINKKTRELTVQQNEWYGAHGLDLVHQAAKSPMF